MPQYFFGGGSGMTAIALTSGTGYPTALGTAGDIYRATDGYPGAQLFSYVGPMTGMPTIVNAGRASSTATGALNITMARTTTVGNTLVAIAFCETSASNLTLGLGWTSILTNNTPTPAVDAAYQTILTAGTTVNPYTVATQGSNSIIVLEIANAGVTPIVGGTSGSNTSTRVCTAGNFAIIGLGGMPSSQGPLENSIYGHSIFSAGSTGFFSTAFGSPVSASGANISAGSSTTASIIIEIAAGSSTVQYWKTFS